LLWREVEELLRKVVQEEPQSFWANVNLGTALSNVGECTEANQWFSAALTINPDEGAMVFTDKAALSVKMGDESSAIAHYLKAIELDGTYSRAYHNLAWLYVEKGDLEQATPLIQKAILISPDDPWYLNTLGRVLQKQGNLAEAAKIFIQALSLDADLAMVHNNLGNTYIEMGDHVRALAALEQAFSLDADMQEVHRNFADLYVKMGDNMSSIRWWNSASALNPDSIEIRKNLAIVLFRTGNHAGGLNVIDEALKIDPHSAEAHHTRGCFFVDRDPKVAIQSLRAAIAIDPMNPMSHTKLGEALLHERNYLAAIAAFQAVVAIEKRDPAISYSLLHLQIASLLKQQGDFQGAVNACKAALALGCKNALCRSIMQECLAVLQQRK
jgi:tetratricopeptide (TPR) repeat protein